MSAGRQVASLGSALDRVDVIRLDTDLPPGFVSTSRHGEAWLHRIGRASSSDESLQLLSRLAANVLDEFRPNLVHGFGAVHAGYVAATLARQAGIPSVVSLRGNDLDRAMFHGPRLPFLLWTLEHATALVGVSDEILAKARALVERSEGLHRLQNGVDVGCFRGPTEGEEPPSDFADARRPWIGFFGEARLKKGLPVLIDLADRLGARGEGTLFLFGGVRGDEAELGREVTRLIDRRTVRTFAYERDPTRVGRWYRHMDAVVFPSLWDGMPNAMLEAMASERTVVAVAVGGIPEVITHGENGFLVPPSRLDTFAAAALDAAKLDDAQRASIGGAARATVVARCSIDAERDGLLSLYRSLT